MQKIILSRIGAISYMLWGLLHIVLGVMILHLYFDKGTVSMLMFFGLNNEISLTSESTGVIGSLGVQHAANLAIFGITAFIIAFRMNWNASPLGFWLNFIMLGLADTAFVIAFFIPGYISGVAAVMGPLLFICGFICTGLAVIKK